MILHAIMEVPSHIQLKHGLNSCHTLCQSREVSVDHKTRHLQQIIWSTVFVQREGKCMGCPSICKKYRSLRNQVVNILRQSKVITRRECRAKGTNSSGKLLNLRKPGRSLPWRKVQCMRSPQMLTRLLYLTIFFSPLTEANSMVSPSTIPPETIFAQKK